MTKKDYIAFAKIIHDLRPMQNQAYYGQWCADVETLDCITGQLADLFASDNPRFDRDRFIAACNFHD